MKTPQLHRAFFPPSAKDSQASLDHACDYFESNHRFGGRSSIRRSIAVLMKKNILKKTQIILKEGDVMGECELTVTPKKTRIFARGVRSWRDLE